MRRPSAGLTASLLLAVLSLGACGGGPHDTGAQAGSSAPSTSGPAATSPVGTLIATGLHQLNSGDWQAAQTTFENVLTLDPDNLYARYNLGLISQQQNQNDVAVTQYRAALEVDPTYAPALYNLGMVTESSDLGASVSLYQRAVAADPTFAAAYMRLGFAQVHLGDRKQGQIALGKGVALDPSMADVQQPSYG